MNTLSIVAFVSSSLSAGAAIAVAVVHVARWRRDRRSDAEKAFFRSFRVAGPDPELNAFWARLLEAEEDVKS